MPQLRPRYLVPIHSETADKVLFGLTARQLLLLLIGGSSAYLCWLNLACLTIWGTVGWWLRFCCALPLLLAGILVALVPVAERPLELWLLLWLLYRLTPRTYVWRRWHETPDVLLREGQETQQREEEEHDGLAA